MTNPAYYFGPPRDRRRRKRLLTKKNVFFSSVISAVVLTATLAISDMRAEARDSSFTAAPASQTVEVRSTLPAESTADATWADPLLVENVRRSQALGVSSFNDGAVQVGDFVIEDLGPSREQKSVDRPLELNNRSGHTSARFAIRGDAAGVTLSEGN